MLPGCHGLQKRATTKTTPPTVANTRPGTGLAATTRVGPALPAAGANGLTATAAMRRSVKETRVGEVRVIGGGRRFVLIEISSRPDLPLLAPGLELRSRVPTGSIAFGGEETATLRVSPERRQPFIVADVISGEPHVDDPVFFSPDAAAVSSLLPTLLQEPVAEPVQSIQPPPSAQGQTAAPASESTPRYRATATVHPSGE